MLTHQQAKPRPIRFNNLSQFVYGSFTQSQFQNFATGLQKTGRQYQQRESLFDRYNRNNLKLKQCQQTDIQTLSKNLVVAQGQLSSKMIQQIVSKSSKNIDLTDRKMMATGFANRTHLSPQKAMASTGLHYRADKGEELVSRQYKQNEILFNYQKIAQQKKAKKEAFLSQIQARITMIENEAKQLEEAQLQEKLQIGEINKMQETIHQKLAMDVFNGKIKQMTRQYEYAQKEQSPKKNLNIYMGSSQINEILDDHFQINENLIDQVNRISRSKDVAKQSNGFAKSRSIDNKGSNRKTNTDLSMKQTMKFGQKPGPAKKIMMSTMKCPPKAGKGKI